MKVLPLFLLVCVLAVSAQRRPSKSDTEFEATSQKSIIRGRGRTRFALTPEYEEANEEYKQTLDPPPRRKTEHFSERKSLRPAQDINANRRSYEVREVIDDIPRETIPKLKKKPHVITESKFEAVNAPKKDVVVPSPIPADDLIMTSSTQEPMPEVEMSSEKTTEKVVVSSSESPKAEEVKPNKPLDRHTSRIRTNLPKKVEEPTPLRGRTRTRIAHSSTTVPTNTIRNNVRVNRRRPEPTAEIRHNSLRTKGPSVFSADTSAELPSRSRPGRKVTNRVSEQVPEESNQPRRRVVERRKLPSVASVTSESPRRSLDLQKETPKEEQQVKVDAVESTTVNSQRRDNSRLRQTVRATPEPIRNVASAPRRVDVRRGRTTDAPSTVPTVRRSGVSVESARGRSRVKPADNADNVVTNPTRGVWSRRRTGNIDDIDAASTTQTEVKVKVDSLNEDTQNIKVSLEKSFSVETKPGRIRKRPSYPYSAPVKTANTDDLDQPSKIPLLNVKTSDDGEKQSRSRGRTSSKKGKDDGLTNSQERIEDSDNYPAPFKAALKAKSEGLLGSRTNNVNEASNTKTTEATVTSSIPSTSLKTFPYAAAGAPSAVNKNEETPTTRSKYSRPRFSLTTKQPKTEDGRETRKYSPERPKQHSTTTSHSENSNEFHARYKSPRTQVEDATAPEKPPIKPRTYIPKPPKGLYSSRKFSRSSTTPADATYEASSKFSLEPRSLPTKVPSVGLSARNRFSARYRNDILPKSVVNRLSTTSPSYIPTVPTVTPSSSMIKIEDRIRGLEVISIVDQVPNTLPSDNLVNDASSKPEDSKNSVTAQTEKTMSFIERIINSITAISTTTSPDASTTQTTTNGQPTKTSAILSLVSKRTSVDSTALKQTLSTDIKTTEKPTTIIEQILSSLTAIQADSATESTASNTIQIDEEDKANQLSVDSRTAAKSNLSPVVEFLGGKTIDAFNNIVNQTEEEQSKVQTLNVDPLLDSRFESGLGTSTTAETTSSSTTTAPTTTTSTTTTTTTTPASTTTTTTTPAPTITTTAAPTTTTLEITTTTPVSTTTSLPTTPRIEPVLFTSPLSLSDFDLNANGLAIGVSPKQPPMTLIDLLTNPVSTTTVKIPSLNELEINESRLTEKQKQDLAILRSLEKEQEAILKQLSFLTGLNLRGGKSSGEDNLANRVIAQAVENSKEGATSQPNNAAAAATINDMLKQMNMVTTGSPVVSSTYGPTTPKGLSDAFTKQLLTTKAPTRKTTATPAPGPFMQGLNWLLNTLSPQPTPKPKPVVTTTTTTTTTTTPKEELINQATTVVPVVARFGDSPMLPKNTVITDKQLEALIMQLEEIQKDPKKAKNLDIKSLKSLQNAERVNTNKISSTKAPVTRKPLVVNFGDSGESSTPLPLSIANSVVDVDTKAQLTQAPVAKEPPRSRIPPVKLNPVPGVPEEGPIIRGQLVNYAINITKAISSFLGTALQDASNQFVTILSSDSENSTDLFKSNYSGNVLRSSSSG